MRRIWKNPALYVATSIGALVGFAIFQFTVLFTIWIEHILIEFVLDYEAPLKLGFALTRYDLLAMVAGSIAAYLTWKESSKRSFAKVAAFHGTVLSLVLLGLSILLL